MSWLNNLKRGVQIVRDVGDYAQLCATAIDAIGDIVHHWRHKDANLDALGLIEKVVAGVKSALGDERPLAEVRAEILKLKDDLAGEDAAADAAGDAALDKKFPPTS